MFSAPFYFLGKIELGVMTQTAQAFGNVNDGLNFFVNYYRSLAEFRAVLDRLTSFDDAIETAKMLGETPPHIEAATAPAEDLRIADMILSLPNGKRIVQVGDLSIRPRQSALLMGPSGSGKSTLFRAIAGIWPFGFGRVSTPAGSHLMVLPQKPYFPNGLLRSAVAYPSAPETFSDAQIAAALEAAQLGDLVGRLDESDVWSQRLSGGEQQRLAIARALLARPDWLLLDEATASLDEANELLIYKALVANLPDTTLISIAHHAALRRFHRQVLTMKPGAEAVYAPQPEGETEPAK